jgi:C-terminal processing protease CtpA/Prc
MLSRTLLLVCWFPALASAQQPATPVLVDRQLVAAGVWSEARQNYAYWDAVRADWDSAFAAVITQAASRAGPPASDVQSFRRLRGFVALLRDPQADLVPPPATAARVARPPLALRSIERRPFILDYATNDEMRIARPERLAEIIAVQGLPAEQWIRDSILPEISAATEPTRWERAVARMLEGEKGTALHLLLRLPGGAQRGASVTRSVSLSARWPLEPPAFDVDTLPGGAIWVRVTSFADPAVVSAFDRALGDAPRLSGLVLDLREAGEGAGIGRENGYAMLARLIERPVLTSRWRTPQYRPAYRGSDTPDSNGAWLAAPPDTIRPRRDHARFAGPVAVLASPRTAGAAEDLLVAFRNGSRGPIIGETSAGSTGQTLLLPLRRGWQFRMTVTRDAFPDGTEFARTGIAPEIPVTVRVDEVLAGRDAVLERAREYLKTAARR